MKSMNIPLNINMIHNIFDFLSNKDCLNLGTTSYYMNFCVSKKIYKKTIKIKATQSKKLDIYNFKNFNQKYKKAKVSINLVNSNFKKLVDMDSFHNFSIIRSNDLDSVKNIRNLNKFKMIECSNLKTIQNICNIKYLDLTGCTNLMKLTDFSKIQTLNLSRTNISDVSLFKNIKNLHFKWCNNLVDVSMLGKQIVLDLSGCKNIKDFSNLGHVEDLNLTLTSIGNLEPLKTVKKLNLTGCANFYNLSSLKNVDTLILNNTLIRDVSFLTNVQNLSLHKCVELNKIENLPNVENLNISWCELILNLSNLPKLKILDCRGVRQNIFIRNTPIIKKIYYSEYLHNHYKCTHKIFYNNNILSTSFTFNLVPILN